MKPNAVDLSEREESEELRQFRQAWQTEVQTKTIKQDIHTSEPVAQGTSSSTEVHQSVAVNRTDSAYFHSVDKLLHDLESLHVNSHELSRSTIAIIVETFPSHLEFAREDEEENSPLVSFPEELILYILRYLDHASIERFAMISRKARVLTLDSSIWRDFVISTYKPPQIPSANDILDIVKLYSPDYRRLYIEHPRVRLDGVYIAVCRYVRPGLGDNAWVSINHLITYRRYLRFLPDGQVVSLLASDQIPPQEIIPYLDSSFRMKGLFIGNWELEGTTVFLDSLADPSGTATRYVFQMTLQLRSRPLGRWNRLEFMAYDSVKLDTGEAIPVSLKQERSPFVFSRVRSYL